MTLPQCFHCQPTLQQQSLNDVETQVTSCSCSMEIRSIKLCSNSPLARNQCAIITVNEGVGERGGLTSVPCPLHSSSPVVWDGCLQGQSITGLTAPGWDDAFVSCLVHGSIPKHPGVDTNIFIYTRINLNLIRGLT